LAKASADCGRSYPHVTHYVQFCLRVKDSETSGLSTLSQFACAAPSATGCLVDQLPYLRVLCPASGLRLIPGFTGFAFADARRDALKIAGKFDVPSRRAAPDRCTVPTGAFAFAT